MTVPLDNEGTRYFDLYHGVELMPRAKAKLSVLSFPIEAHGYGAILAISGEPGADVTAT